jgi:predicted Rossmann fold flavoprotein
MHYDAIIIGAGAAGLFCAMHAGERGKTVLLVDHASKPAEKIRISGGGRCNFTNLHIRPENFISDNPRFCLSALKGYTQHDFIALIEAHGITYHEKTLGQLFCDNSAQDIISMLLNRCADAEVELRLQTSISDIVKTQEGFSVLVSGAPATCTALVIATGGLSIPKMGASAYGYDIAKQFGHTLITTQPALVPFTAEGEALEQMKSLAGISLFVTARIGKQHFAEGMLFTHRGLSGPAMLQLSSYWDAGTAVIINMLPDSVMIDMLLSAKKHTPKQVLLNVLSDLLPKRLAASLCGDYSSMKLAECSDATLRMIAERINAWQCIPSGTEGYRTAEVTKGGVNTREISSKTMESQKCRGLYFIGEVLDVTGHLGGYNFQWAWSSGYAVAMAL